MMHTIAQQSPGGVSMRKKLILILLAVSVAVVAAVIAERSNRHCLQEGHVIPFCVQ
jgi:hypothetical protein